MVYVYSCIKEIKTMQLKNMSVTSELGREIYAVRLLGVLKNYKDYDTKIEITIDDGEEFSAIIYKKVSVGFKEIGRNIKIGDKVIIFAHLEPINRVCSVDIIRKASKAEELMFLAGLFKTYFDLTFE